MYFIDLSRHRGAYIDVGWGWHLEFFFCFRNTVQTFETTKFAYTLLSALDNMNATGNSSYSTHSWIHNQGMIVFLNKGANERLW